ncbi:unnamed protein product [Clavelina lepadiformis]|uniref:Sugar phosphate exchanger 3 n=1 Tax=Clavelina lepadiformis TaxID=159417 RepID=A0ABP0FY75_CLALP
MTNISSFSCPKHVRFELRKVLSIGMWLSGCMIFLFGTLTQWIHFYNKALYITLWCLNGLFQGTGWPCVVAIMGNWFGKSERGLVFGIWSANAPVGNIFGSLIASALIDYGYEIVFLYASFSIFCGGIVMFFGVVSSPLDLGLEDPNKQPAVFVETQVNYGATDQRLQEEENSSENETNDKQTLVDQEKRQHAINFFKAILLPGVIAYSLAFAFLKMVNYGFFIWLPYYVTNEYGWPDTLADKISIWYDVGNILGGVVAGFISDRSGQRTPTLFAMLICGPFVIWGYSVSPNDVTVNSGLLFLVGFFIGGACNVIATAVTADIGKQEAVGKDTQALATVTGIIDGTGSVGAGIGQYLVAVIQRRFGWKSVFYFFMSAVVVTLVCLLPLLVQSFKSNGLFNKVRKKPRLLDNKKNED